eukprot:1158529-Pelagomonas_calceolata.AAC.3
MVGLALACTIENKRSSSALTMVSLITLAQSSQDADGLLHAGLVCKHLSKGTSGGADPMTEVQGVSRGMAGTHPKGKGVSRAWQGFNQMDPPTGTGGEHRRRQRHTATNETLAKRLVTNGVVQRSSSTKRRDAKSWSTSG